MKLDFRIVVEPQEYSEYSAVIDPCKVLVLPFSNLGQGSIPARNFCWEHAKAAGHRRHWILDDNIRGFYRLHKNLRVRCYSGAAFAAIEDFVDRYTNVPLAGMQYVCMARDDRKWPPFVMNTRIYSCILIDNALQFRWRGRYNEDTDLSLRVLKSGACTMLFNSFLCNKMATMTMRGGNTEDLYKQTEAFDGRLAMAQSLQQQHPDVTKIKFKWGRWQHSVSYARFKKNKLIRRREAVVQPGVNEFGMKADISAAAQSEQIKNYG